MGLFRNRNNKNYKIPLNDLNELDDSKYEYHYEFDIVKLKSNILKKSIKLKEKRYYDKSNDIYKDRLSIRDIDINLRFIKFEIVSTYNTDLDKMSSIQYCIIPYQLSNGRIGSSKFRIDLLIYEGIIVNKVSILK